MSTDVFPNKRPKLFGAGEDSIGVIDEVAQPGLTGVATLDEDSNAGQDGRDSNVSGLTTESRNTGLLNRVVATFADIVTPADSVIILVVAMSGLEAASVNKDWQWQRDSIDYLDGFTLSGASDMTNELKVLVDNSPDAGTHTYTLLEDDANQYGAVKCEITFVKLTDTHQGIIAVPATAIKQIITADSHTTKQTEVIP